MKHQQRGWTGKPKSKKVPRGSSGKTSRGISADRRTQFLKTRTDEGGQDMSKTGKRRLRAMKDMSNEELVQIVRESKEERRRASAVEHLSERMGTFDCSNLKELETIAIYSDKWSAGRAVDRIPDTTQSGREALERIALETEHGHVGGSAVWKISQERSVDEEIQVTNELFQRAKNKDEEIAAVKRIDDDGELAVVARRTRYSHIANAATKKIGSISGLAMVIESCPHRTVKKFATQRLLDNLRRRSETKNFQSNGTASQLATIAAKAKNGYVRRKALEEIRNGEKPDGELLHVAVNTRHSNIAMGAVEGIGGIVALAMAIESCPHRTVKRVARQRLLEKFPKGARKTIRTSGQRPANAGKARNGSTRAVIEEEQSTVEAVDENAGITEMKGGMATLADVVNSRTQKKLREVAKRS
jgi:hypothetical protein